MLDSNLKEYQALYLSERHQYLELAEHVKATITDAAATQGISCTVLCRAKEIRSLSSKLITKPYTQIGDKAGARVVVHFPWMLREAEDLVESLFRVLHRDDKREGASPKVFSYRATHFQVVSPAATVELQDKECEVQVLTRAESLWADTEHDIAYKSSKDLPVHIRRSFYRLVSLMELFDLEVSRVRNEMNQLDDFPGARLLIALEPYHRRYVGGSYDGYLSGLVLNFLTEHIIKEPVDVVASNIDSFLLDNQQKLENLLARYKDDDYANPLIWQPELLAILYCLDNKRPELQQYWSDVLPFDLLNSLATDWGTVVYQRV